MARELPCVNCGQTSGKFMPADVAAPCWAQEDLFLKVFLSALLPKHVILITKRFAILFLCALNSSSAR